MLLDGFTETWTVYKPLILAGLGFLASLIMFYHGAVRAIRSGVYNGPAFVVLRGHEPIRFWLIIAFFGFIVFLCLVGFVTMAFVHMR